MVIHYTIYNYTIYYITRCFFYKRFPMDWSRRLRLLELWGINRNDDEDDERTSLHAYDDDSEQSRTKAWLLNGYEIPLVRKLKPGSCESICPHRPYLQ